MARVFDADQRGLTDWLTLLPGAVQSVPLAEAGRYTVEFRDSNNDERSLIPYRVAVAWPGDNLVVRQEQSGEALPPGAGEQAPPKVEQPAITDQPPPVIEQPPAAADDQVPPKVGQPATVEQPPSVVEQPPPVVEQLPVAGGDTAPDGGKWTQWFDIDDPGASGDWEPLPALVDSQGVCQEPKAIECQTLDGKDWSTTGQAYRCEPGLGGICRSKDQPNQQGCLDYRVRFECP